MPPNRFVEIAKKLLDAIEHTVDDNKRQKYAYELQRLMETADKEQCSTDLEDLVTEKRLLVAYRQLVTFLEGACIATAIYRWKNLGYDHLIAPGVKDGPGNSWKSVLSKLEDLSEMRLGHFSAGIASELVLPRWAARAVREEETVDVFIQRDAAIDIMLAAIETYRVRLAGKKKIYTEMYGLCVGHVNNDRKNIIQVNVERYVPQLRAVADHESVRPDDRAKFEHIKLLTSRLPEKRIVGECHTHPYDSFQELTGISGGAWNPSKPDLSYFAAQYNEWIKREHRPEIALIIAIGQKEKAKTHRNPKYFGKNTFRHMYEGCEMVFAVHRIMRDGYFDEKSSSQISLTVRL